MELKIITEADLVGRGVIGMADTPNLSARRMQEKVEEVVRSVVIPVMNENAQKTVTKQDLADAVFNSGAGDMQSGFYDGNTDGIVDRADNGLFVYTQSENILSGSGANGKFKATAGGRYTAFTIDGQSYAVQSGGEKETELTEGVWYTFVLDTEDRTINFNMGGAVSVPDGKTAMPTNDKDIWLKCASLKSDKTIEEIVNDEQLCAALMSTQNSVEYMMRSANIQRYVLKSVTAIAALDASLPFTTPEMTSNTEPFGEVTTNTTANQYTPGAWGCFNTELTGYYITDGDDKYLQWKWDRPVWAYKFRIKDIYGNNSKVHLQAVLEDGSIADISDSVSVPKDTLVYQNANPHLTKAVGFRIYIDQSSLGANNWVDYGAIKVWGKYYE